ncbi:MAG: DUF427 domain-containing protein [Ilumatobacteraceae bacterium]
MSAIPDLQAVATGQSATVRIEPSPRRVRVRVGAEWVADSDDVLYLFEQGHLPVYYFPWRDVRRDLLEPSATTTHCPRKGDASYWSIRVGDRLIDDAVWSYPEVIDGCPDITQHVAFSWNEVDGWFEEDDEVFVHARDPYKRIDTVRSSRHVQVLVDGTVVADSHRPVLLYETGLPTRYYLPRLDVREDLLEPSATTTACPYKGVAEYRSVRVGDQVHTDVVWTYPAPIPEIPKIEHHLCFFNERVDIVLDGVPLERPVSPWS